MPWSYLLGLLPFFITSCQPVEKPKRSSSGFFSRSQERESPRKGASLNTHWVPSPFKALYPKGSVKHQHYMAKKVQYGSGLKGQPLEGILLRPQKAPKEAVLVTLHGKQGFTRGFQRLMLEYVAAGYVVLALDLYGGKLPKDSAQAQAWAKHLIAMSTFGNASILQMLDEAFRYIRGPLRLQQIAVLGWGLGGRWAVDAAIFRFKEIRAAINYYGSPLRLGDYTAALQVPLLQFFSKEDPQFPYERLLQIEKKWKKNRNDGLFFRYFHSVRPGFMEPEQGQAFHKETAILAHGESLSFLEKNL